MPGEAEEAAKYLGIPFEQFQKTYLVRDYWAGDRTTKFDVFAPLKIIPDPKPHARLGAGLNRILSDMVEAARGKPGERTPYAYPHYLGRCVFLDERERCKIHPVKPTECRVTMGCGGPPDAKHQSFRRKIAAAWIRFWRKEARRGS